jgi:hypothetical protein
VNTSSCRRHAGLTLLYVGIAPRLLREDLPPSRQTLRSRVRYHYKGNAEGSTLRLTLGCLLAQTLGLALRRVGSGRRLTFGPGEATLSTWMEANAFVAWIEHERPWEYEEQLIHSLSLPLNLQGNEKHEFAPVLARLRSGARAQARGLPILT